MIDLILKIAKRNRDGFTFDLNGKCLVQKGIIAAYEATQNSFEPTDLEKVVTHAINHDNVVGGWYDSKSNQYYFDSCKVFDNLEKLDYRLTVQLTRLHPFSFFIKKIYKKWHNLINYRSAKPTKHC